MKLIDKNAVEPKFRVGDKLISTRNPSLTYEVLEVGHINELGNLEYKVIIFADGKAKSPQDIHYLECKKVDEWAKLLGPKFKARDWIVSNVSHEDYRICKILNNDGEYVIESIYGYRGHNNFETFDKDYHLWSIKDAKDGDVLVYGDNPNDHHVEIILLFKSRRNGVSAFTHFHIFNGKFRIYDWCDCGKNVHPATKEQRDLLFQKMKEAGYEWDAENLQLTKILPVKKLSDGINIDKQKAAEWSENVEKKKLGKIEDEEYNGEDYGIDDLWHAMNILEKTLGKVDGYQTDDGILEHKCAITAVKKLYEQKPTWSQEDREYMESLLDIINGTPSLTPSEVECHKDWLKNLKQRIGG